MSVAPTYVLSFSSSTSSPLYLLFFYLSVLRFSVSSWPSRTFSCEDTSALCALDGLFDFVMRACGSARQAQLYSHLEIPSLLLLGRIGIGGWQPMGSIDSGTRDGHCVTT
jgi:hypothetical protein